MLRKSLTVLGTALGLTACLNTSDPFGRQQNYGFLILEARAGAETGYVVEPNALFYRTGPLQLPTTQTQADTCIDTGFSTDPGGGVFPPAVNAGPSISIQFPLETVELVPVSTTQGTRYVQSPEAPVSFVPGDTVTLLIDGAVDGFPAWELDAKTSELFTHQPVPIPEVDQSLVLTWDAATATGSKMLVSLRYRPAEGQLMRQLYCELIDDGQHQISAARAAGWREGLAEDREVVFSRWRIRSDTKEGSVLLTISTFEVPTPVITEP